MKIAIFRGALLFLLSLGNVSADQVNSDRQSRGIISQAITADDYSADETMAASAGELRQTCPDPKPFALALFGSQTVEPGAILAGRLLAIVENIGHDTTGSFSVGFYLSDDEIITTSDDLLLGGREFMSSLPALAAGLVSVYSSEIPIDYPVGSYFLGMLVDDNNSIEECDENNNYISIPITIAIQTNDKLLVPSEYTTIADAITAASSGDTIVIDAGEYDEALVVSKNLIFIGSGTENTILKNTVTDDQIMLISKVDVSVRDLQFWAWPSQPGWISRAIDGDSCSLSITNCKFFEIGNFCVYLHDSKLNADSIDMEKTMGPSDVGVQLWDSEFELKNSYGGNYIDHIFDVRGNSGGIIHDNVIDGSTVYWGQGIRVMDNSVVFIHDNVIIGQHNETTPISETGPIPSAIALHGGYGDTSYVEAYDNDMQGFIHGLYAGAWTTAKIYDNTIHNNVLYGMKTGKLDYETMLDLGGGQFASSGKNSIQNNGDYNIYQENAGLVFAKYNYWGSYDSIAIDNTLYDNDEDPTLGEVLFTPWGYYFGVGLNIHVIMELGITITFDHISSSGITSADTRDYGPVLPGDYIPVPPIPPVFFDINTNAIYSDNIEICIGYNEEDVTENELNLRLLKYQNSSWVDITSSLDISENIVCGTSSSLSLFTIVEAPSCCLLRGDIDRSGGRDISDLTYYVDYMFGGGPEPPCFDEGDVDGSGSQDISDLTYYVDYMFGGGPEPPPC